MAVQAIGDTAKPQQKTRPRRKRASPGWRLLTAYSFLFFVFIYAPLAVIVRTPGGRLSRAHKRNPEVRDFGTREAQARRLTLVNGGDPALFSLPVDVAYARGFLDREQHTRATKFCIARLVVFGMPLPGYSPVALLDEPAIGGRTPSDAEAKRREDRYTAMLRRLSEEQQLALVDLALDRYPRWLRCAVQGVPISAENDAERQTLLEGLDRLS